ncbi:hypothetical protein [Streptomyces sp. YIM S03343]
MATPPSPDVSVWVEHGRRVIMDVADMLGLPPDVYSRDPQQLIPPLQDYVSKLPLSEFEQSDWVTLHTDLLFYVAGYLIQRYGARWVVADDPHAPRGYRYAIEAQGRDGQTQRVDPADVVMTEFNNLPIEITRMLAGAELTLRLTTAGAE